VMPSGLASSPPLEMTAATANPPLTIVQIAYQAGKTLMRTVSAGSHGGTKATQAGNKARERVRECAKQLRTIGETWTGGLITAEILEKDLEAAIEKQSKRSMPSPRSPMTIPAGPSSTTATATRTATASSPKALAIIQRRSPGSLDDDPGSPPKKRRSSPSITGPVPKRTMLWGDQNHHHTPSTQASYNMPAFPISDYSLLLQNPPTTSQYPSPLYSPPLNHLLSSPHASLSHRAFTIDPLSGQEKPTSMNQYLLSGSPFSGAPSSETPVLHLPFFVADADADDIAGEV